MGSKECSAFSWLILPRYKSACTNNGRKWGGKQFLLFKCCLVTLCTIQFKVSVHAQQGKLQPKGLPLQVS